MSPGKQVIIILSSWSEENESESESTLRIRATEGGECDLEECD